jgi:tRNA G10  N-methylase Trm11
VRPINLLDPFCGTGVILQEALLMGYGVIGTDIEPRMVEYSRTNLEWFKAKFKLPANDYRLDVADATTHNWDYQFTLIASETYLGRPFTNYPGSDLLAQTINDCNLILRKFLINIRDQLSPGTRLCLAVPAWQVDTGVFKHLSFIDRLSDLGYNRVSFKHVMSDHLLYYRENQIVGRELLVLIRK